MATIITEGPLLVSIKNGIKTITFSQPHKRNAINGDMAKTFRDVVLETKNDESRVVILTGAGNDFCAGAELDPRVVAAEGGFNVTTFLQQTYNPLVLAMREMNKPFIAKVRGNCVGVGFSFALACDMILASQNAKFSQIFTRIGLSSDGGGSYFMQEKLGYHKAFELMATNAILSAEEAKSYGLINQLHADENLDKAVQEMADSLANGPLIAIKHTKANLRRASREGLAAALEEEAQNQGINFTSEDFFEGIAAFLQKRKANFKGK
ncbi:MAG: enoyl-CoA hydratase-related protein [Bacteroidota bacterium]